MSDKVSIIEGLQAIRNFFGFGLQSQATTFRLYDDILTNAINALKEKTTPLEPIQDNVNDVLLWRCAKCGFYIAQGDHFCSNCGRMIAWE